MHGDPGDISVTSIQKLKWQVISTVEKDEVYGEVTEILKKDKRGGSMGNGQKRYRRDWGHQRKDGEYIGLASIERKGCEQLCGSLLGSLTSGADNSCRPKRGFVLGMSSR